MWTFGIVCNCSPRPSNVCLRRLKRRYQDEIWNTKKQSKKWTTSNTWRKGCKYVQQNIVLQPGLKTLQKNICFLSFRPGFIHHIFTYIEIYLNHTESWKNDHGKLCVFCYAKVTLSKLVLYFQKFDCILEECIEILIK